MRIADSALTMSSSRRYTQYAGYRTTRSGRGPNSGGIYNDISDQSLGSFQNILSGPLRQVRGVSRHMNNAEAIRSIRMHLLHRIFDFLRGFGYPQDTNMYEVTTGASISGANGLSGTVSESAGSRSDRYGLSSVANDQPGSVWVRSSSSSFLYHEEESTSFITSGMVRTADGREIDFGVELSMTRSFTQVCEQFSAQDYFVTDPLVINVDSGITHVSDFKFLFDLDCDGIKENISFAGAGSGFLALDLNNDGVINDGSELFGTKSGNGFADLAKYDTDKNGWIDEADEIFDRLKVWTKDEFGHDTLLDLRSADVGAICLRSADTQFSLNNAYNGTDAYIRSTGIFLHESGGVGTVAQVDMTH